MRTTIYILSLLTMVLLVGFGRTEGQDLDNTFGTNGKKMIDVNSVSENVRMVKIQSDGKILISGVSSFPEEYYIIRLNADGTLDNSFDSDGKLTFTIPGASNGGSAYTMTLQTDGKILVGGSDYDGTTANSVIVRLNTNGSFDNTFGVNGIKRFSAGSSPSKVTGIFAFSDGKIKAVGMAYNGSDDDIYMVKLNSDGSFDTSFDVDGMIQHTATIGYNQPVLQSDNKIVIANYTKVHRFNEDGSFDNTFGLNGTATITGMSITAATILESGKIILAGKENLDFAMMRLNADGSVDNSFDTDGINTTIPPGFGDSNLFRAVAEDTTNNKVIAAGYTYYSIINKAHMAVVEYLPNGEIEDYTTIAFEGNQKTVAYALSIQADRKILAAGIEEVGSSEDIALARLNADFNTLITNTLSAEKMLSGLNLFPNPASQKINIHSAYQIQQIQVLDLMGKEVLNQIANGNSQIDISDLSKGLYNFVITTDQGIGSKKISIQ